MSQSIILFTEIAFITKASEISFSEANNDNFSPAGLMYGIQKLQYNHHRQDDGIEYFNEFPPPTTLFRNQISHSHSSPGQDHPLNKGKKCNLIF